MAWDEIQWMSAPTWRFFCKICHCGTCGSCSVFIFTSKKSWSNHCRSV